MTKIKKVAAGILAAVSLAACVGGMSASAAELHEVSMSEYTACNSNSDEVSTYSTTGHFSFNVTSGNVQNIGKVVASSDSMTLYFSSPSVGQATIRIRTGSYYGSIYKAYTTPAAGNTTTTISMPFSVTKGTTYYIQVVPAGGYAQTVGSFSLKY